METKMPLGSRIRAIVCPPELGARPRHFCCPCPQDLFADRFDILRDKYTWKALDHSDESCSW